MLCFKHNSACHVNIQNTDEAKRWNSVLNRSCGWLKCAAGHLYTSSFSVTESEMKATEMMVAELNIRSVVFPWCLPSQLQPVDVSVKMSCNYTCKHAWQVLHRRTPNHNLTPKECFKSSQRDGQLMGVWETRHNWKIFQEIWRQCCP